MRSFWQIFWLEITAFVRSRALLVLIAASIAWMFAFPQIVTGDGTTTGARELYLHYSLGGVFALLILSLLASATGSLARERAAKRLQLTLVRPVNRFSILAAKGSALTLIGAMVLALAALILYFSPSVDRACRCAHVLSPILPTPHEEAKAMYSAFMASPETPEAVKKAKKDVVLRLLENRAIDRYETIPTNGVKSWKFDLSGLGGDKFALYRLPDRIAARFRFSGAFNRRETAVGELRIGGHWGSISNLTQSTLTVPLWGARSQIVQPANELTFTNRGSTALQFRPRRDIHLLVPADTFGFNLLRAYLELVAMLALLIAFGLLLSAAFSRPVALFVAWTILLMSEMSPSVLASYPDELETSFRDRIGLVLTRAAAEVTRPISALEPLAELSRDECIEWREVGRVCALDFAIAPAIIFLLASFVLKRKLDEK